MKTDIEIAIEAEPKTIDKIADQLGIVEEYLERYGKFKSKVDLSINDEKLKDSKNAVSYTHLTLPTIYSV